MTKDDIASGVKQVFADSLSINVDGVKDGLVIGEILLDNPDLQMALQDKIRMNVFINSQKMTVGELITDLEKEWDGLTDWERRRLAEV